MARLPHAAMFAAQTGRAPESCVRRGVTDPDAGVYQPALLASATLELRH